VDDREGLDELRPEGIGCGAIFDAEVGAAKDGMTGEYENRGEERAEARHHRSPSSPAEEDRRRIS
jgi:hypothetical protein